MSLGNVSTVAAKSKNVALHGLISDGWWGDRLTVRTVECSKSSIRLRRSLYHVGRIFSVSDEGKRQNRFGHEGPDLVVQVSTDKRNLYLCVCICICMWWKKACFEMQQDWASHPEHLWNPCPVPRCLLSASPTPLPFECS